MFNFAIFIAAAGITLLEMAEASAVGLALYSEIGYKSFAAVSSGAAIVLAVTFLAGNVISSLPIVVIRLVAAALLLYFGLRLAKSARKAVIKARMKEVYKEKSFEKNLIYVGFSVGLVESFEAAIVLVALIPISFDSALLGLAVGLVVVCIGTILLRSQIRKIKQANMKIVVSGLLLAFSMFWLAKTVTSVPHLLLVPLFLLFAAAVYYYAHMADSKTVG